MTCESAKASALWAEQGQAVLSAAAKVGVLALAAAAFGAGAVASEQEVSPPVPIELGQPEIPTNQFGWPIEGWAKVRYSVLADGTTADSAMDESA